jgi:hypothetical protein
MAHLKHAFCIVLREQCKTCSQIIGTFAFANIILGRNHECMVKLVGKAENVSHLCLTIKEL